MYTRNERTVKVNGREKSVTSWCLCKINPHCSPYLSLLRTHKFTFSCKCPKVEERRLEKEPRKPCTRLGDFSIAGFPSKHTTHRYNGDIHKDSARVETASISTPESSTFPLASFGLVASRIRKRALMLEFPNFYTDLPTAQINKSYLFIDSTFLFNYLYIIYFLVTIF